MLEALFNKVVPVQVFFVNIGKFLRIHVSKNIFKKRLLNVVFKSNETNIFLLDWMKWGKIELCLYLFISFWCYYVCILFRGSHTEASFKKLFLKILENSQENTRAGLSF